MLLTPVVGFSTVLALTSASEGKLRNFLEEGRLSPAFNLSRRPDGPQLVRISSRSVECLALGRPNTSPPAGKLLESIWPEGVNPTCSQIARQCCLSPDLVIHWLEDRLVAPVKGTPWHSGTGGSPRVLRPSLIAFLSSREIGL
jgi:hypothetical protein